MNTQSKLHSEIDFHIIRDGQEIHKHTALHNLIGNGAMGGEYRIHRTMSLSQAIMVYTNTTTIKEALSGTFSQSGSTITRVSGSFSLETGEYLYVFADGTRAGYRTAGSGTSITVSTSQNVSAQTLYRYRTSVAGSTDSTTNVVSNSSISPTYSAGVSTWLGGPYAFAAAASPYTIARITIQAATGGTFYYDLPTPISLIAGDVLVVSAFRLEMTHANPSGIVYAVSPITGITSGCRIQRMWPIGGYSDWASQTDRMLLLTTPNAKPFPSDIPLVATSMASITGAVTYNAVVSKIDPIPAADSMATVNATIVFPTTVTDIKQIFLGSNPVGAVNTLIEFDTPQTFLANKALTIRSFHSFTIDIPAP